MISHQRLLSKPQPGLLRKSWHEVGAFARRTHRHGAARKWRLRHTLQQKRTLGWQRGILLSSDKQQCLASSRHVDRLACSESIHVLRSSLDTAVRVKSGKMVVLGTLCLPDMAAGCI